MPQREGVRNSPSCDAIDGERVRSLPQELSLLFVGPEEPSWTLLTLQLDHLGCTRPRFSWCSELSEAASTVRQNRYDCIVIDDVTPATPGAGPSVDLSKLPAALRTGGCEDPILVLTDRVDDVWLAEMADADCELLMTRVGWRSPALAPWIRGTIERHNSIRELQELSAEGRQLRARETNASQRQLEHRRDLCRRLRGRADLGQLAPAAEALDFTAYSEVLQAILLTDFVRQEGSVKLLAGQLSAAGWSVADVLQMHVDAVAQLLRGLGGRSAGHVLERADLIALELFARLAEHGRQTAGH